MTKRAEREREASRPAEREVHGVTLVGELEQPANQSVALVKARDVEMTRAVGLAPGAKGWEDLLESMVAKVLAGETGHGDGVRERANVPRAQTAKISL